MIDANALADKVDESKHNNPHTNGRVRVNHYNEHDHFLKMIFNAPTVQTVPYEAYAKLEEKYKKLMETCDTLVKALREYQQKYGE
jgi:hypothetical protein